MTIAQQDPSALQSDAALLDRARAGDGQAFRVMYDRHLEAIRGYALGRVGPDGADDIVSETFATAWRACGGFDAGAASARPWLYGIATNVIARHRQREKQWLQQHKRAEALVAATALEPTAYELDPALANAIAELSPALRDTLLLTALADLTVAEAGRALGISATAARVRLLRARRLVERSLQGEPHGRT